MSIWEPIPQHLDHPVAIIGGGVLGRRLAVMWASRGGTIHLCDSIPAVREQARLYFEETAPSLATDGKSGNLVLFDNVQNAVETAWLVIECIPERLQLKIDLFEQLDQCTHPNAILLTNSSSFKSSEMISKVKQANRVANMHAFMPPKHIGAEIMTCGQTSEAVLDFMMEEARYHGFKPFRVRKESSGFIYNRVWAAIKREALLTVSEGAATVEDLDGLFRLRLGAELGPFQMMDATGLDVVLDIEEHYAAERTGLPEAPRQLLKQYVGKGHLGQKTGRGFYEYPRSQ